MNRRKLMLRKRWHAIFLVLGLIAVAFAGSAFWQASRTLRRARRQLTAESEIPAKVIHPGLEFPGGIDTISSPAVFDDAIEFQGSLNLAGPGGFHVFGPEAREIATYRTGLELPPHPLTGLATGFLADSSQPELFIARRGGGLLIFNGKTFNQILPTSADCRELTAVLSLANRRLLLGTAKHGLLVYDGKELRVFQPKLADIRVTALAETTTRRLQSSLMTRPREVSSSVQRMCPATISSQFPPWSPCWTRAGKRVNRRLTTLRCRPIRAERMRTSSRRLSL